VFVSDSPQMQHWPPEALSEGHLLVMSTTEVYGDNYLVEPLQQRATFGAVVADALSDGYSGVRVAADNTSLVSTALRFVAWKRWEAEAEDFIRANPVTGLCAFNLDRIDPETIAELRAIHPVALDA